MQKLDLFKKKWPRVDPYGPSAFDKWREFEELYPTLAERPRRHPREGRIDLRDFQIQYSSLLFSSPEAEAEVFCGLLFVLTCGFLGDVFLAPTFSLPFPHPASDARFARFFRFVSSVCAARVIH